MGAFRAPALLVALAVITIPAAAQEAARREGGARPGFAGRGDAQQLGQRLGMMPLMKALDTDQDGTLSAAEIQNASRSLASLDKNRDGSLSPDELRPDFAQMAREASRPGQPGAAGRPGQPGPGSAPSREMMSRMFETRDADKDGKLSGDEIPERMRANLERVDMNSDGAIDRTELEQAMSRLAEQAGRQPGGRRAGGNDGGEAVRPKRPSAE